MTKLNSSNISEIIDCTSTFDKQSHTFRQKYFNSSFFRLRRCTFLPTQPNIISSHSHFSSRHVISVQVKVYFPFLSFLSFEISNKQNLRTVMQVEDYTKSKYLINYIYKDILALTLNLTHVSLVCMRKVNCRVRCRFVCEMWRAIILITEYSTHMNWSMNCSFCSLHRTYIWILRRS